MILHLYWAYLQFSAQVLILLKDIRILPYNVESYARQTHGPLKKKKTNTWHAVRMHLPVVAHEEI